jgi:monothiol glutaredoxin
VLNHLGVDFKGIDILTDPGLRQGIKEFSQWPTIPQLYVKGEFVGGSDIVREMFSSGELVELFQAKGVAVAAEA